MFAVNPVGWDVLASPQVREFLLISHVDEESRPKRKRSSAERSLQKY